MTTMMITYEFTNNWFDATARKVWDELIVKLSPARILEVGSYEGASTCYLIETLGAHQALEIHCVDTWLGGIEHAALDMAVVEQRFARNIQSATEQAAHTIDVTIHKAGSDLALSELLASGKQGYFDFVYIDGSHQAPDVLCDAVLGFRLLRNGGVMAFDDYLWQEPLRGGADLLRCPKPAIDAFTNLHMRQLRVIRAPLNQLYVQKTTA